MLIYAVNKSRRHTTPFNIPLAREGILVCCSMLLDTPGWYEFTNNVLLIWEGICAVSVSDVIQLYKIRNHNLISVVIKNIGVNVISSNGYWQCVELQGTVGRNKAQFYYHAESPAKACLMIESLLSIFNDTISDLVARFDPDPFRFANVEQMKRRIREWKILVEKYCENGRIVLESNMPM